MMDLGLPIVNDGSGDITSGPIGRDLVGETPTRAWTMDNFSDYYALMGNTMRKGIRCKVTGRVCAAHGLQAMWDFIAGNC